MPRQPMLHLPARRVRIPERVGLFVALSAATVGNLIFHVVVGRGLGPADYGVLSALLTVLFTLAVPAGAVQAVLTARVVRLRHHGRHVEHRTLMRTFTALGCMAAGVVFATGPVIVGVLQLSSLLPVLLMALFFIPALAGLVLRAVLLGHERYRALGAIVVAGVVLRIALGVVLIALDTGLVGALIATLVSEVATTIALAIVAAPPCPHREIPWRLRVGVGEVAGGIAAFSGLWLLIGMDIILARNGLDAVQAGSYAASALAARSVLFLPQSIITAAIPAFAAPLREARTALADALMQCLVLGLAASVVLLTFAGPSITAVLGSEYLVDEGVLALLAAAALWFGLLTCLTNYHLTRGDARSANRPWFGFGLLMMTSLTIVDTPRGLAIAVMAAGAVAAIASALPLVRLSAEERPVIVEGPSGGATVDWTVVVPFRNEEDRAAATVARLCALARSSGADFEVIAVSDGSTDGGDDAVAGLHDPAVTLIRRPVGGGKGQALRTGMRVARGRIIAFVDGDGDIDPTFVLAMIGELQLYGADAVIGSKRHPRSVVHVPPSRRCLSLVTRVGVRLLAGAPVPDTQTGAKAFSRALVADVLPRTQETGFLFDLELLIVAKARGWNHLVESPVAIQGLSTSSVSATSVLCSGFSMLRLMLRVQRRPRRGAADWAVAGVRP